MAVLIVPRLDDEPWPTLGGQVCDLIEERAVYGPGSLKGKPAVVDAEFRAAVYRAYEVYPQWHEFAGRRRFNRVGLSWRKGTAKTEKAGWLCYVELHPEGPVRCDGFDAYGEPVGRPVVDPYIPMVAFTEGQADELAYGVLYVVCSEGPDADLFDAGADRILRLDEIGRADGKAESLASSPNARDGARTTFQHFDETHRMFRPDLKASHETMLGNIPKRPLEDPWSLETTTAGQPGQNSIAEDTHAEARAIASGEITDPQLFYFHREAGTDHDMKTLEGRIAAVAEATGPVGEYAPGQYRDIARQWDRPKADKTYLERVWLNRWTQAEAQAFDPVRWAELGGPRLPKGSLVAVGFDGARRRDSTAIVITDIPTGRQVLWDCWEKPLDAGDDWEVPEAEVTASMKRLMAYHQVWKVYADPPYWVETVGAWAGRWPGKVQEWWTNRRKQTAYAVRAYVEAQQDGAVTWDSTHENAEIFALHIAAAGKKPVPIWDDEGRQLFILQKIHTDRKFDCAMAATLSWQCRLDALAKGIKKKPRRRPPRKINAGVFGR